MRDFALRLSQAVLAHGLLPSKLSNWLYPAYLGGLMRSSIVTTIVTASVAHTFPTEVWAVRLEKEGVKEIHSMTSDYFSC